MRVPDPWVIDQIKRHEDEQRRGDEASWHRQPHLDVPFWQDAPKVKEVKPTLDGNGVVDIDFSL